MDVNACSPRSAWEVEIRAEKRDKKWAARKFFFLALERIWECHENDDFPLNDFSTRLRHENIFKIERFHETAEMRKSERTRKDEK